MGALDDQWQTRSLAIILPSLTFMTHSLLFVSFALEARQPTFTDNYSSCRSFLSALYNLCAAGASVLGLLGAIRRNPALVSCYTFVHTTTLALVTFSLLNIVLPTGIQAANPVVPSWQVDVSAICRDIDDGFGWEEGWASKCRKSFDVVMLVVGWSGLVLMVAQWWALVSVWRWGKDLKEQKEKWERKRDEEKAPIGEERRFSMMKERHMI